MTKEYKFEFVIAGLAEVQAIKIMEDIIHSVEMCGGTVGGGFEPIEEVSDVEKDVG